MVFKSPHFQDHQIPKHPSLEHKILIFQDRVTGWQLDIAQEIADRRGHRGFAVLHIVTSYFEMIGKFLDGYRRKGPPSHFFRRGASDVFPNIPEADLNKLYHWVRNSLYHSGITEGPVRLSWDFGTDMKAEGGVIDINPQKLVEKLQEHFSSYVSRLFDPNNETLRSNFKKRFRL